MADEQKLTWPARVCFIDRACETTTQASIPRPALTLPLQPHPFVARKTLWCTLKHKMKTIWRLFCIVVLLCNHTPLYRWYEPN